MTELKGSETEQILINSFAGESQAVNRYTFFSKVAKNEGYEQIAAIFLETAENEREHAKLFYKYLGNIIGHVDGFYPFEYGTTEDNLLSAIKGEKEESDILYYNGAKTAEAEGFKDIAETFNHVRNVEKHHQERYAILLENVKNKTVFKKDTEESWICRKCGYIYVSKEAPEACPNCGHPRAYFQLLCEKF